MFIFFFTFTGRLLLCYGYKSGLVSVKYLNFVACLLSLSTLADSSQRAKELSIFLVGEVVYSLVKYIKMKKPMIKWFLDGLDVR